MEKELSDAFRKLKQRDVDTFPVEVVSVNKSAGTCKVKDDTLEYTNVRLSSIIKPNGKGFFLFPKVGSSVLVSPINEDLKQLYIEAYSEIESMSLKIDEVEFRVDDQGFLLKKQNETLKALMSDFLTACSNMSFLVSTTGTAAAQTGQTTLLNNSADFVAIKNRFNQFLKEV